MLRITGDGVAHTCDGLTRRDFLQVGTLGAVGLSLVDLMRAEAQAKRVAGAKPGNDKRSVIMIFNLGAPSQIDTWDMKRAAPSEIRRPFRPIAPTAPNIRGS